jgi:hypothetical protein
VNPTFNPDNWIDLTAYFLIGLPALVAALGTFKWKKEAQDRAEVAKTLAEATLYEVKNDHRSNLRDDIDGLSKAIKDGFAETRSELHQLRDDLRTERVERIDGDRRKD